MNALQPITEDDELATHFGTMSATSADAPAFRLGNLLSLPNAGKWRGRAFAGMVVERSALDHPGVEIQRLLDLEAIFPATRDELLEYDRIFGEPLDLVKRRSEEFVELRASLRRRLRAARKNSAKVTLLEEFIREWSAIESQCRATWSGDFGCLVGKTEKEVRAYYLERESALRTLGGREDIYRDVMREVAEPLLVVTAGLAMEIKLLHDFLGSTAYDFARRNPLEYDLLQWLPVLRYKLLHAEKSGERLTASSITTFAAKHIWQLIFAAETLLITGLLVHYLRAHGINLK